MTKDETKRMIMYLRNAYTGFGEGADLSGVVDVWFNAFMDEDISIVSRAAVNYVKASEYPPTIAGIQKQIALIKAETTDGDLWASLIKAAKNSTYGACEEFDKLPRECQQFVGSPTALRDFGQIDAETLQTVVRGQFMKAVPAIREHARVRKGLPADVKLAIENAKMKLLEDR